MAERWESAKPGRMLPPRCLALLFEFLADVREHPFTAILKQIEHVFEATIAAVVGIRHLGVAVRATGG